MGREIELKIPLTDSEYQKIFSVICGKEKLKGVEVCSLKNGSAFAFEHILKSDSYFSRYNSRSESKIAGEPQVIRLRSEQIFDGFDEKNGVEKKTFFCIKRKTVENGIELNSENETFVEKPEVIHDLLTLSGYHQFFEKSKDAFSAYCKSEVLEACIFHIELEIVNGLKYLEVEVTDDFDFADSAENGLSAADIRLALEKFVALFDLDASKKDSRSWMEILRGGAL